LYLLFVGYFYTIYLLFLLQDFDFLKRDFEALKLENEGIKHQLEVKDKLIKVSG